jgi:hypothetical protein
MSGFRSAHQGPPIALQKAQAGDCYFTIRGSSIQQIRGNPPKPKPHRSTKHRQIATFFRPGFREGALAASKFPDILTDSRGTFHQLGSW